jgi:hypothetical protein
VDLYCSLSQIDEVSKAWSGVDSCPSRAFSYTCETLSYGTTRVVASAFLMPSSFS